MKITQAPSPNFWSGGNRVEVIIVHWWGEPSTNPSLAGVVRYLRNPGSQVSAHYVVSDDSVVQLVQEDDRAWHAQTANHFSIGIEVDPKTPGDTYQTVAELVRDIRARHGDIPLKRHSDYVNTRCPGTIDLGKIEKLAKGEAMHQGKTAEQWAKEAAVEKSEKDRVTKMANERGDAMKVLTTIAEERGKYLHMIADALGMSPEKIEKVQTERMVAMIADLRDGGPVDPMLPSRVAQYKIKSKQLQEELLS